MNRAGLSARTGVKRVKITLEKKYFVAGHCCTTMKSAIELKMLKVCCTDGDAVCIAANHDDSWYPFKFCPYCGKPVEVDE